jgi:nicotinamidase-related amidase
MRNHKSNKEIHILVDSLGITEVDFCGIADIYCVKDSIEDFHREFPDIKINVLIDFIGFMDEKKFNEFLEKSDYINVKKVF